MTSLDDVAGAVPTAIRGDVVEWTRLSRSPDRFVLGGIRGAVVRSDVALLRKAVRLHARSDAAACVIAQMSRCGSTLLAACMSEVRDVVVLSEVPIVSELIDSRLLRGVLGLYAQRFGVRRVVVKLSSIDTPRLARFRRHAGDPPAVLLFRDPVEVAVSNLLRPAQFMRERRRGSPEQHCALVLTAYLRALLAQSKKAAAVVDYAELDPLPIVDALLGPLTPAERRRIAATARVDAKKGGRFRPDSDRKQRQATPRLRAALAEAMALYERLAERQRLPTR